MQSRRFPIPLQQSPPSRLFFLASSFPSHSLHCIIEPPYLHLPSRSTRLCHHPSTKEVDLCLQPSYHYSLLLQTLFLSLNIFHYCASFAEVLFFHDLSDSDAHLSIADSGDTYRPVSNFDSFLALLNFTCLPTLLPFFSANPLSPCRACAPPRARSACCFCSFPLSSQEQRAKLEYVEGAHDSSIDPRSAVAARLRCCFLFFFK